ncbi:phosphatase PAP2 family protein [Novosphingobium sp. BL-8A]|uniref:phosphatase PAP2 family protein n=1 Tax=Novosphingobium sp. BL-8A TaxID=3127639 RepID=UPI003757E6A1
MKIDLKSCPPEVFISGIGLIAMLLISIGFDLPIVMPASTQAKFLGLYFIYPMVGVVLIGLPMIFLGKRKVAARFLIGLPCYTIALFVYFNVKLWIPHLNSHNFDGFYWKIDEFSMPLIYLCMAIRRGLLPVIPYEANFYLSSYMMLFYISFLYHAIRTPEQFGKLIVAVILLQLLSIVGYVGTPAVGPFIFQNGLNPIISQGQHQMLNFYFHSLSGGGKWIASQGGANFTAGLAAMPSLHAGGAFLFFMFARKHGKVLVPPYAFILFYILVTAIASRWHYVIDIPVGMGLAWFSYTLADRLSPAGVRDAAIAARGKAEQGFGYPAPVPALT